MNHQFREAEGEEEGEGDEEGSRETNKTRIKAKRKKKGGKKTKANILTESAERHTTTQTPDFHLKGKKIITLSGD